MSTSWRVTRQLQQLTDPLATGDQHPLIDTTDCSGSQVPTINVTVVTTEDHSF